MPGPNRAKTTAAHNIIGGYNWPTYVTARAGTPPPHREQFGLFTAHPRRTGRPVSGRANVEAAGAAELTETSTGGIAGAVTVG